MISRQEAFEILGISENARESDIETRYNMLIKRYRADNNLERLEEISLAYNIIKGRYVEPEPEDPRMQEKIFGKPRSYWKNSWEYGKIKAFAIVALSVILIYLVYTIATNQSADFQIALIGEIHYSDGDATKDYISNMFDDVDVVQTSSAFLSDQISQHSYASSQKAVILLTVSGEDIIIVDSDVFYRHAPMGAFKPLDDLFSEISGTEGFELAEAMPAMTVSDVNGQNEAEFVFGIDVSSSQLLSSIGISGREQIITVSVKSERPDHAKDFIRNLFDDVPELFPRIAPLPSPTPAAE